MNTTEIKAKWRSKIEKLEALYHIDRGVQIQLDPDEFTAVAEEGLPPKLHRILRGMQGREPTCVLLTPKQLKLLLNYEPERRQASHQPPDVPGRQEPLLDDQVDVEPDRQGTDEQPD